MHDHYVTVKGASRQPVARFRLDYSDQSDSHLCFLKRLYNRVRGLGDGVRIVILKTRCNGFYHSHLLRIPTHRCSQSAEHHDPFLFRLTPLHFLDHYHNLPPILLPLLPVDSPPGQTPSQNILSGPVLQPTHEFHPPLPPPATQHSVSYRTREPGGYPRSFSGCSSCRVFLISSDVPSVPMVPE